MHRITRGPWCLLINVCTHTHTQEEANTHTQENIGMLGFIVKLVAWVTVWKETERSKRKLSQRWRPNMKLLQATNGFKIKHIAR